MHTSSSSDKKVDSVFAAAVKAAGGDSTIISSEGSGSPDSPIKHGIKELRIQEDNEVRGKEIEKKETESKTNDPFGLGWW